MKAIPLVKEVEIKSIPKYTPEYGHDYTYCSSGGLYYYDKFGVYEDGKLIGEYSLGEIKNLYQVDMDGKDYALMHGDIAYDDEGKIFAYRHGGTECYFFPKDLEAYKRALDYSNCSFIYHGYIVYVEDQYYSPYICRNTQGCFFYNGDWHDYEDNGDSNNTYDCPWYQIFFTLEDAVDFYKQVIGEPFEFED